MTGFGFERADASEIEITRHFEIPRKAAISSQRCGPYPPSSADDRCEYRLESYSRSWARPWRVPLRGSALWHRKRLPTHLRYWCHRREAWFSIPPPPVSARTLQPPVKRKLRSP